MYFIWDALETVYIYFFCVYVSYPLLIRTLYLIIQSPHHSETKGRSLEETAMLFDDQADTLAQRARMNDANETRTPDEKRFGNDSDEKIEYETTPRRRSLGA